MNIEETPRVTFQELYSDYVRHMLGQKVELPTWIRFGHHEFKRSELYRLANSTTLLEEPVHIGRESLHHIVAGALREQFEKQAAKVYNRLAKLPVKEVSAVHSILAERFPATEDFVTWTFNPDTVRDVFTNKTSLRDRNHNAVSGRIVTSSGRAITRFDSSFLSIAKMTFGEESTLEGPSESLLTNPNNKIIILTEYGELLDRKAISHTSPWRIIFRPYDKMEILSKGDHLQVAYDNVPVISGAILPEDTEKEYEIHLATLSKPKGVKMYKDVGLMIILAERVEEEI